MHTSKIGYLLFSAFPKHQNLQRLHFLAGTKFNVQITEKLQMISFDTTITEIETKATSLKSDFTFHLL